MTGAVVERLIYRAIASFASLEECNDSFMSFFFINEEVLEHYRAYIYFCMSA